jgi:NAD(P)-dependent dehydrogenase (short-subunit alcohol dehydrogenase family)
MLSGKNVVMVLGARLGTGNIGEAIYNELDQHKDWLATWNSCWMDEGYYDIPADMPFGDYDALVVTLGKEGITPMDTTDDATIADIVRANLVMPLQAVRAWVQAREGYGGRCVLIGSYAYDHSPTSCVPYCAAKAGLAHAVQGLAWELTPMGFNFNIVHPYHVPSTPMGTRVVQAMMEERGFGLKEAEEYQRKDLRLEHHLHPTDIARVVAWLLTEPVVPWLSGAGLSMYGGVR